MADDLPEKLSLGKKLNILKKEMKEQNFSFIPKLEITPNDIGKDKIIIQKIHEISNIMKIYKNEATYMEGLDWLEKNGQYGIDCNFSPHKNIYATIIDEITMSLRRDRDNPNVITDKILNKYIDIYNKFAKKWQEYNATTSDATNLAILFEEHAKNMSKETAFKFLDALEKTAVHNNQSYTFVSYADRLKIDKISKQEFLKRAKALDDKLPKYGK